MITKLRFSFSARRVGMKLKSQRLLLSAIVGAPTAKDTEEGFDEDARATRIFNNARLRRD
jgi:hypothetical protein